MGDQTFNDKALEQKARSERLYLHYALALASLLFVGGVVLTVLGVGDHLDIVVERGDIKARFVNATPGVALALFGVAIFMFSKPRRLAVHSKSKTTTVEAVTQSHPTSDSEKLDRGAEVMAHAAGLQRQGDLLKLYQYLSDNQKIVVETMGEAAAKRLIEMRGMEAAVYVRQKFAKEFGPVPAKQNTTRTTTREDEGGVLYQRVQPARSDED